MTEAGDATGLTCEHLLARHALFGTLEHLGDGASCEQEVLAKHQQSACVQDDRITTCGHGISAAVGP